MTVKKIIKLSRDNWMPAISDGLTLPCSICDRIPPFDYSVDSKFWNLIVDDAYKRGVICLPCLDKLAFDKGHDISTHLESVQFTGIGKTIELLPSRIFQYEVTR